jgi:hypothetical protein
MGSIKAHWRRRGDIRGSRTWQLTNKFCPLWLTSKTLKTHVKLNLNFTRPHAITYTNKIPQASIIIKLLLEILLSLGLTSSSDIIVAKPLDVILYR